MKFYSHSIVEHTEVPLADDGRLEKIVSQWQQRKSDTNQVNSSTNEFDTVGNRSYVVSVVLPGDRYPDGKLSEILALVKTQGDTIVGFESHKIKVITPKTYLGSGAVLAIVERAIGLGATMLVLDAELTPSQTRNLEHHAGITICDREAVILNVFLKHAKTRAARNNVEIAQLQYLRPRIRGLGMNMDQQAGGILGSRGPGETASELMARQLDDRLVELTKVSKKLKKAATSQRKSRRSCKRIVLVGYTNAGKTSLMNGLTGASLSVRNRPFETLDTTTRALSRELNNDVLLSDTVGFIRNLPNRLLASFESSLSEISETDLVLIVIDATDPELEMQLRTTEIVLTKLDADSIARLYVFNKIDKLDASLTAKQCSALIGTGHYLCLSSFNDDDMSKLRQKLLELVFGEIKRIQLRVSYQAQDFIRKIYAHCRVLSRYSDEQCLTFVVEGQANIVRQLQVDCQEYWL